MKRKNIAVFVALILVMTLLPAHASGDFTIDRETGYITSFTGTGLSVTVPSSVDGIAVSGIGAQAFSGNTKITSVVLPEGLTYIGEEAFYSCTSLTSITLPDTLTEIDRNAFLSCVCLRSVELPDGLTTIRSCAFRNCNRLTSVSIPDSVTTLEGWVFWNCTNLPSVKLPAGMRFIPSGTFYLCSSLKSVSFSPSITAIGSFAFSSCTSIKTLELPSSVRTIGENAFSGCNSLTLYCPQGSHAASYCEENELRLILTVPQVSFTAKISPQRVLVDGLETAFEIYNIGGSNYFKLRDLAYALMDTPSRFGVGFDGALNTVTLTTGASYIPVGGELAAPTVLHATATTTNDKLIVDDIAADIAAYKIGGSNYFKLRDLGNVLGFEVDFDSQTNTVLINSVR